MKLLATVVYIFSNVSFASSNCYKAFELEGRNEMVQKLMHSQSSHAAKLFEQFCKSNATKVKCLTKTVSYADEKKIKSEMIAGKPCGELSSVKNSDNTVTLYFFDAKRK